MACKAKPNIRPSLREVGRKLDVKLDDGNPWYESDSVNPSNCPSSYLGLVKK
jgi:hypothetical protein